MMSTSAQALILFCSLVLLAMALPGSALQAEVTTADELAKAVNSGAEGDTIEIAEGTYELAAPLEPKAGMTLRGAGIDRTIITHQSSWKPSTSTLPDPEMRTQGMDTRAFLIRLTDNAPNVTITGLTLRGPQMHGAIFGWKNESLHIHHVKIDDTLWTGIRTFAMHRASIHDCEFVNAGGRWQRGGKPGVKGGITGGAIFAIWMRDSEIFNNRFTRTQMQKEKEFYGIKVRQGRNCRIHHNTIAVNFSIEMPFENDENVEIDHNILHGTVSIPKHAGGMKIEEGQHSFHIHHNYSTSGYAIEFPRNGVEINHNLFDFKTDPDGGNLISGFGKAPVPGPALFHNNLVNNPGRGVLWSNEPLNNVTIRNNHIIARTTVTPRQEGLFGFNSNSDFSTYMIKSNVIECRGLARPLFRNDASYEATVKNNKLINVSDANRYENPQTGEPVGLEAPLKFECGVNRELTVDGWVTLPTQKRGT